MTVVYAFDHWAIPNGCGMAVFRTLRPRHAEAARDFIMIELVTKQDLQTAIDTQTLRLTVRLGGIVAAGVAVLGAGMGILALFLKLH